MAKHDLSRHQEKIVKRYYDNHETIQNNKLAELISDLWITEDEKTLVKLWGRAQTALMRLGVDATTAARIAGDRDMDRLAKLAKTLDAGGAAPQPQDQGIRAIRSKSVADGRTLGEARAAKTAAGGYDSLEEDNLKKALRAFRKKLKTLRRDDESKLGGRYVSAGRASSITAITPPPEYPKAVWEKLVELKRLCHGGQGTYELPEDAARR